MNYRQKPNGIWVVDYQDDQGKRRRVSTGIKTPPQKTPPPEAREAGREIVLGIRQRAPLPQPQARKRDGRLTMSELFDRCEKTVWHPDNARSQATIRSNLKKLRGYIGDVAVEDMTFSRLEKLVSDLKGEGLAPATVKRKLDMVSKALRMATMWTDDDGRQLLSYKPPMPRIKISNLKERTISALEEEAIFNAVEKRRQEEPGRAWFQFASLLVLLWDTAGRLSETLGLGPDNVNDAGGQSYITFPRYRTKSGKPRTVPATPRVMETLGSLMSQLVPDKETGEWRFFGIKQATAWYMFKQIREDVARETGMDLSDVTLHTIRHTTLTRLGRGGMPLAHLQLWAGHSDPKITAERYLHLKPSDLDAGLSILTGSNPTPETIRHESHTSPGNVPSTTRGGKGAKPGTATLQ